MEECPGQRDGSTIYYFEGHMYRRNRGTESSTYYRCSVRGCFGRVIQKHRLGTILVVSPHNHPADVERHNLRRFLAAVQRRVSQEIAPIYCIYEEEARRFPGIEKMMPFHTVQQQLEKRRRIIEGLSEKDAVIHQRMESHVERFLEQRLEQFADHGMENNFDQHSDQNHRAGFPRCEVTMNNQGGDKLHFNGYSYSKKAISANAIRWTCATPTRSEPRCKGAITTDRERPYNNPRSLVEHNHPPEDPEASIMRDIARAKRRMRRRTYPHPFPFYPWMFPLQQMQEQSGGRDDPSALEATLGMGVGTNPMDSGEAGPSGYGDDVRVKMEPEWVDAGALEPNCELEGQYEDASDYNAGYGEDSLAHQEDQNYHQMYSGQQQHQSQTPQLPLVPDSQDPVKLRVPGKPNLTITVAPTRQGPTQPPPLHLLNPRLNRKRGRPRGSAYGSYNENDDRVTTILTDTIIASRELEKLGAAAYHAPRVTAAMSSPLQSRVKPRSKDPEAVKAAEIINKTQNRSGPNVTEELEKVHLKLRQEVLALEVQNLKAEREKLRAYRRNVAVRREIMVLHLLLGKGIPSECASSGRGLEIVEPCDTYMDTDIESDLSNSMSKEQISISKRLPDVSISRSSSNQSPKISVRKSLQTSTTSPNVSPLSSNSSAKCATPPPLNAKKSSLESQEQPSGNKILDSRGSSESTFTSECKQSRETVHNSREDRLSRETFDSVNGPPTDSEEIDMKLFGEPRHNMRSNETGKGDSCQQSVSSGDPGKDELVPLDSVSSDLSIEMLSEPGSSQWTNQSSAPMTEHEGFEDLHFEGEDSYDNPDDLGEFSGGPISKEPPDMQYSSYSDENAQKKRRVENMWEPDENPL